MKDKDTVEQDDCLQINEANSKYLNKTVHDYISQEIRICKSTYIDEKGLVSHFLMEAAKYSSYRSATVIKWCLGVSGVAKESAGGAAASGNKF